MSLPKIVVYTAISKGYDTLKPIPKIWQGHARFVAFLDEPQEALGWEIRPLCNEFKDPCRNAKMHKVLPHKFFPEADYTLWVDGSVTLKSRLSIQQWPGKFLAKSDLVVFKHSKRRCIYVEGAWCILQGYDDARVIDRQMEKYFEEGYPKDNGLALCLVLFRRRTAQTIQFNEGWWQEIKAHSRRDQLSFNYVASKQRLRFAHFPGFIGRNSHFHWGQHIATRSQPQ